jgi:hypothetical protein
MKCDEPKLPDSLFLSAMALSLLIVRRRFLFREAHGGEKSSDHSHFPRRATSLLL